MSEILVTPYIRKVEVIHSANPEPGWLGPWVVSGFQNDGTGHRMGGGYPSEIEAWAAVERGAFDSLFDIDYSEKLIAAAVLGHLKEQATPDLTKELLPE